MFKIFVVDWNVKGDIKDTKVYDILNEHMIEIFLYQNNLHTASPG